MAGRGGARIAAVALVLAGVSPASLHAQEPSGGEAPVFGSTPAPPLAAPFGACSARVRAPASGISGCSVVDVLARPELLTRTVSAVTGDPSLPGVGGARAQLKPAEALLGSAGAGIVLAARQASTGAVCAGAQRARIADAAADKAEHRLASLVGARRRAARRRPSPTRATALAQSLLAATDARRRAHRVTAASRMIARLCASVGAPVTVSGLVQEVDDLNRVARLVGGRSVLIAQRAFGALVTAGQELRFTGRALAGGALFATQVAPVSPRRLEPPAAPSPPPGGCLALRIAPVQSFAPGAPVVLHDPRGYLRPMPLIGGAGLPPRLALEDGMRLAAERVAAPGCESIDAAITVRTTYTPLTGKKLAATVVPDLQPGETVPLPADADTRDATNDVVIEAREHAKACRLSTRGVRVCSAPVPADVETYRARLTRGQFQAGPPEAASLTTLGDHPRALTVERADRTWQRARLGPVVGWDSAERRRFKESGRLYLLSAQEQANVLAEGYPVRPPQYQPGPAIETLNARFDPYFAVWDHDFWKPGSPFEATGTRYFSGVLFPRVEGFNELPPPPWESQPQRFPFRYTVQVPQIIRDAFGTCTDLPIGEVRQNLPPRVFEAATFYRPPWKPGVTRKALGPAAFALPTGDGVHAARGGTVAFAYDDDPTPAHNLLLVIHDDAGEEYPVTGGRRPETAALYRGFTRGSMVVQAGRRVTRGQVLGKAGGGELFFEVADLDNPGPDAAVPFRFSAAQDPPPGQPYVCQKPLPGASITAGPAN